MLTRLMMAVLLLTLGMTAAEEGVKEAETQEEEPLLSFLDYVLLAAIAAVCYWWFYLRDNEADKIPEVY